VHALEAPGCISRPCQGRAWGRERWCDKTRRRASPAIRGAREASLEFRSRSRLDDSASEVFLPDAVHRYARRQRVFRVDQPAGEIEPRRRLEVGRKRRSTAARRLDTGTRAQKVAPDLNMGFPRGRQLCITSWSRIAARQPATWRSHPVRETPSGPPPASYSIRPGLSYSGPSASTAPGSPC